VYNPISFGGWRPVLARQPAGVMDVALTFDDGPTPETTPRVLGMLAGAGAKATFFLSGVRVAAYPELVSGIVADGHAVYGHGWEHTNLERVPARYTVEAMRKVEDVLARFRPTPTPYLIRLPYNAGHNRSRIHRAITRFHPNTCFAYHTFSTFDYLLANGCESREELGRRCCQVAQALCERPSLPGGIILMHEKPFDNEAPLNAAVIEMLLPLVLRGITARGFSIGLIQPKPARRLLDRCLLLKTTRELTPPALN
jgi:peptidoglycan-N-acetylglucosamine deacetylase